MIYLGLALLALSYAVAWILGFIGGRKWERDKWTSWQKVVLNKINTEWTEASIGARERRRRRNDGYSNEQ